MNRRHDTFGFGETLGATVGLCVLAAVLIGLFASVAHADPGKVRESNCSVYAEGLDRDTAGFHQEEVGRMGNRTVSDGTLTITLSGWTPGSPSIHFASHPAVAAVFVDAGHPPNTHHALFRYTPDANSGTVTSGDGVTPIDDLTFCTPNGPGPTTTVAQTTTTILATTTTVATTIPAATTTVPTPGTTVAPPPPPSSLPATPGPSEAVTPSTAPGTLAYTGTGDVVYLLVLAVGFLAVGTGIVICARRRDR